MEHNCLSCKFCEFKNGKGWICKNENMKNYFYDLQEENDCDYFEEDN